MAHEVQEDAYVIGMLGNSPYNIRYVTHQNHPNKLWIASCPIGRDVLGEYVVTVDSVLHQRAGWPAEFKFGITKNPLKAGAQPIRFFSSNAARPYVPEDERGKVIDVVVESLDGIIGRARPDEVFRQLKEPEKTSRRVHERISEAFALYGYTIEYRWPEKRDSQWVHVRRT